MVRYTFEEVASGVKRALRLTNQADIALMMERIGVAHRDLCQMAPWPALFREASAALAGGAFAPSGGFAGVCYVESGGRPAWFASQGDQYSGDMRGRACWTMAGDGSLKVWDVDALGAASPAEGDATVGYWVSPGASTSGEVSLPSIRALTARAVLDCVGLMDRKEQDANPWRNEFQLGMRELAALAHDMPLPPLRLASGRVLQRAPTYPIFLSAQQGGQGEQQQE